MDADHSEEPEHPKTGIEAFIWGAVNIDSEKGPVTPQRLLEFPVRMPDFHGLGVVPKVIASGARHTLILGECGRIFGWGDNRRGQLGVNPKTLTHSWRWIEIRSLAGKRVVGLACGRFHSLALTVTGSVFAWGFNSHGQIGVRKRTQERWQPLPVTHLPPKVVQVCAGGECSYAVDVDGDVYSWGSVRHGSLGHGDDGFVIADQGANYYDDKPFPTKVSFFEEVGDVIEEIACGTEHLLARSGAQLYACGKGDFGRLGTGSVEDKYVPCAVDMPDVPGYGAPRIFCSWDSSFAITHPVEPDPEEDGDGIKPWHWGPVGPTKEEEAVTLPSLVRALKDQRPVAFGGGKNWNVALTEDGRLYCYGSSAVCRTLGLIAGEATTSRNLQKRVPREVALLQGRFVRSFTCGENYVIAFVDLGRSTVLDPLVRVPVVYRYPEDPQCGTTDARTTWKHERRRKLFTRIVEANKSSDRCSDAEDDGLSRLKFGTGALRPGDDISVWVSDTWAWGTVAKPPKAGWPPGEAPPAGHKRVEWRFKDWGVSDVELHSDDETSDEENPNRWVPGMHKFFEDEDSSEDEDEAGASMDLDEADLEGETAQLTAKPAPKRVVQKAAAAAAAAETKPKRQRTSK